MKYSFQSAEKSLISFRFHTILRITKYKHRAQHTNPFLVGFGGFGYCVLCLSIRESNLICPALVLVE